MNTGTQAAKEAGTWWTWIRIPQAHRGGGDWKTVADDARTLTTFSIANDVAKYFAIIPAMFAGTFPVLTR